jgi:hypothetical protein
MFLLFQNFVGLSVSDGYIATGSETNEVYFTSFSINLCFPIYFEVTIKLFYVCLPKIYL